MEHFAKQIITQKNHKKGIIGQNYLISWKIVSFIVYIQWFMLHCPILRGFRQIMLRQDNEKKFIIILLFDDVQKWTFYSQNLIFLTIIFKNVKKTPMQGLQPQGFLGCILVKFHTPKKVMTNRFVIMAMNNLIKSQIVKNAKNKQKEA